MKPTEFVKVNSQFWGDHLRSVSEHLTGSHSRELPGPLLYPRLMVLTETPDWNILELVGVSREYRSLEVKRHKAASLTSTSEVPRRPHPSRSCTCKVRMSSRTRRSRVRVGAARWIPGFLVPRA